MWVRHFSFATAYCNKYMINLFAIDIILRDTSHARLPKGLYIPL